MLCTLMLLEYPENWAVSLIFDKDIPESCWDGCATMCGDHYSATLGEEIWNLFAVFKRYLQQKFGRRNLELGRRFQTIFTTTKLKFE